MCSSPWTGGDRRYLSCLTTKHSRITCKVDQRKAAAASRTGLSRLRCCATQNERNHAGRGIDSAEVSQSSRRRLLFGAASVIGSTGLSDAPEAEATKTLSVEGEAELEAWEFKIYLDVVALTGSVPDQWVEDFKQALGTYGVLRLKQRGQLQDIYKELGQNGKKKSASRADVATLGDSWLGPAIRAGFLQPLQDVDSYRWWDCMASYWRQLVTRNSSGQADPKGQVWAVPYRWGCTLVAYNSDNLCRRGGVAINDWSDLLQPRLRGRLAFLDSPREFVGVALKTLGLPYNCTYTQLQNSAITLQQLQQRLQQLRNQVRLFSNREHIRALTANDVWAVVGSSHDLIPLASRSSNITIKAPVSGTALWADLWTVPAHAAGGSELQGPSPLWPAWFEFGLMPSRVQHSRGLQPGASPLLLPGTMSSHSTPVVTSGKHSDSDSELTGGVMPKEETLLRSEFLLPLDEGTIAMYQELLTL